MSASVFALLCLLAAGCAKTPDGGGEMAGDVSTLEFLESLRPDSVVEDPTKVGRRYADADIGNGVTRILLYGEPSDSLIDEETGYPVIRVAGCIVTENFTLLVDAYNAAMREHCRNAAADERRARSWRKR